jgi:hypothetical protein
MAPNHGYSSVSVLTSTPDGGWPAANSQSSPVQSSKLLQALANTVTFFPPSRAGLMTIFYCLTTLGVLQLSVFFLSFFCFLPASYRVPTGEHPKML